MRRKIKWQRTVVIIIALAMCACSKQSADETSGAPAATVSNLEKQLASATRPDADKIRDATRKPAEALSFLGLESGMRVVDIIAAGGYYTEVLSIAVGPSGSVVALNPPGVMSMNDGLYEKQLTSRLAAGRLPNVTRLDKDLAEIRTADGPFDFALIALNFHDISNNAGVRGAENVLRIAYTLLRPGGVLGIIDHNGNPGAQNAPLHRLDKTVIYDSAAAAGLVVEAESDLLGQPDDDHTLSVFDPRVLGKTDRFLLRLRKPQE